MSFEVTDLRQPCQKTMSRKCNNKTCTHHIIVLFMLIISYVQYAGAHLMLRVNDTSSYKYPTYAPYGIASPSFNLAGILVMPNYAVDRPCTLKREVPLFLQSNLTSKQSNTTHLVALITETSSKSSKCYTVSQACESAVEYLKWLQEEKHLQGVAVVYALTKHIDGVSGGPSGADYTSYNPSIPDTKYTLPTVLLPLEHSRTILPILTDTTTPVQVHLNYEMGPWNEIVLSPGYYIFIGVFMLINTTFVLRAIGSIFKLAATGKFHPELRTIVFVVGFLSSVCMVIFLPLNSATIVCHSFYEVGSILFTIAFYLILLIWCTIHEVVRTSMKLRYLRAGIVICMCLQTMAYTFKFANHFITPSVTYEYIRTASRYAIVILEFIGALIFLHFGKFFYMQKRSSRVNLASSNALFRLSRISVACFIGFALSCISNVLMIHDYWAGNIPATIARLVIRIIGSTTRSIALLYMLDIRMLCENEADQFSLSEFLSTKLYMLCGKFWKRSGSNNMEVNSNFTETAASSMLVTGLCINNATNNINTIKSDSYQLIN